MKMTFDDIIGLIVSFYLGKLSLKEKEELESWVNQCSSNREEFKRVLRMCHKLQMTFKYESAENMGVRILEECRRRLKSRKQNLLLRLTSYAAAVFVCLGVGYYMIQYYGNRKESVHKISSLNARHGERIAILQLASGEELVLKKDNQQEVAMGEGMMLQRDSIRENGCDESSTEENGEKQVVYNSVRVPKGGEYNLTLADGTNVWLNSDSELRFPARFVGNTRVVDLKGEAFFEVRADKTHPFIVRTGNADIKVLGTAFDVMNYEDEANVVVALQQGKVSFVTKETEGERELKPGEVLRMNKDSGYVAVTQEDVERLSAWRTGYFYFENMPMEELVVKLERWYQVKFVFANEEVKRMRFTGAVKKYNNLNYILNVIEKTQDISFVDFGGKIKVYKK